MADDMAPEELIPMDDSNQYEETKEVDKPVEAQSSETPAPEAASAPKPKRAPVKRKADASTVPCRYFSRPSGCKDGESCRFLHAERPAKAGDAAKPAQAKDAPRPATAPAKAKQPVAKRGAVAKGQNLQERPCPYFKMKGFCNHGTECSGGEAEEPAAPKPAAAKGAKKGGARAADAPRGRRAQARRRAAEGEGEDEERDLGSASDDADALEDEIMEVVRRLRKRGPVKLGSLQKRVESRPPKGQTVRSFVTSHPNLYKVNGKGDSATVELVEDGGGEASEPDDEEEKSYASEEGDGEDDARPARPASAPAPKAAATRGGRGRGAERGGRGGRGTGGRGAAGPPAAAEAATPPPAATGVAAEAALAGRSFADDFERQLFLAVSELTNNGATTTLLARVGAVVPDAAEKPEKLKLRQYLSARPHLFSVTPVAHDLCVALVPLESFDDALRKLVERLETELGQAVPLPKLTPLIPTANRPAPFRLINYLQAHQDVYTMSKQPSGALFVSLRGSEAPAAADHARAAPSDGEGYEAEVVSTLRRLMGPRFANVNMANLERQLRNAPGDFNLRQFVLGRPHIFSVRGQSIRLVGEESPRPIPARPSPAPGPTSAPAAPAPNPVPPPTAARKGGRGKGSPGPPPQPKRGSPAHAAHERQPPAASSPRKTSPPRPVRPQPVLPHGAAVHEQLAHDEPLPQLGRPTSPPTRGAASARGRGRGARGAMAPRTVRHAEPPTGDEEFAVALNDPAIIGISKGGHLNARAPVFPSGPSGPYPDYSGGSTPSPPQPFASPPPNAAYFQQVPGGVPPEAMYGMPSAPAGGYPAPDNAAIYAVLQSLAASNPNVPLPSPQLIQQMAAQLAAGQQPLPPTMPPPPAAGPTEYNGLFIPPPQPTVPHTPHGAISGAALAEMAARPKSKAVVIEAPADRQQQVRSPVLGKPSPSPQKIVITSPIGKPVSPKLAAGVSTARPEGT